MGKRYLRIASLIWSRVILYKVSYIPSPGRGSWRTGNCSNNFWLLSLPTPLSTSSRYAVDAAADTVPEARAYENVRDDLAPSTMFWSNSICGYQSCHLHHRDPSAYRSVNQALQDLLGLFVCLFSIWRLLISLILNADCTGHSLDTPNSKSSRYQSWPRRSRHMPNLIRALPSINSSLQHLAQPQPA